MVNFLRIPSPYYLLLLTYRITRRLISQSNHIDSQDFLSNLLKRTLRKVSLSNLYFLCLCSNDSFSRNRLYFFEFTTLITPYISKRCPDSFQLHDKFSHKNSLCDPVIKSRISEQFPHQVTNSVKQMLTIHLNIFLRLFRRWQNIHFLRDAPRQFEFEEVCQY